MVLKTQTKSRDVAWTVGGTSLSSPSARDSSRFLLSLALEELLDVAENRPNDVIRVKSGWE